MLLSLRYLASSLSLVCIFLYNCRYGRHTIFFQLILPWTFDVVTVWYLKKKNSCIWNPGVGVLCALSPFLPFQFPVGYLVKLENTFICLLFFSSLCFYFWWKLTSAFKRSVIKDIWYLDFWSTAVSHSTVFDYEVSGSDWSNLELSVCCARYPGRHLHTRQTLAQ